MAAAQLLLLLLLVLTLLCLTVGAASASSSAPSSYRCGWCRSRRSSVATASILPPDAASTGAAACGYGTPAAAASSGGFYLAAASAEFFRHGQAACGSCYQLRCRDGASCRKGGVKVVVTGEIGTNRTASGGGGGGRFMLPREAFAAMAAAVHGDLQQQEVDFRRIPCELHKGRSLAVKVEETSSRNNKSGGRLALRFLFLGGQTDIAAVEVAPAAAASSSSSFSWRYLTRKQGVWSTARAPAGPLRLRVVVTAGSGGQWLRADGEVIPAEWVPGGVYDTGLRVSEFAMGTCSCSAGDEDEDENEEGQGGEEFR